MIASVVSAGRIVGAPVHPVANPWSAVDRDGAPWIPCSLPPRLLPCPLVATCTNQIRGVSAGARNRATVKRAAVVARASSAMATDFFAPTDTFRHRHNGPQGKETQAMLDKIGVSSLDELVALTVPDKIKLQKRLSLDAPMSESEALNTLKTIMSKNQLKKSFIGTGYYETLTPGVILRNVLENPGWYTAYTPYQAEIAQGRLTSLLNFQTMVTDLTGMALSNASLLDEATAAAEAMTMCYSLKNQKKNKFYVDSSCHPQNIALAKTRGEALGMEIVVGPVEAIDFSKADFCGVMVQYPNTYGGAYDWSSFTAKCHAADALVVGVTDLMASIMLKPVGEQGFDIAVGSAQRFGVPMGFGGPHAAFLATTDAYSRKMPGRIIGVSIDSRNKPALRMAMQTREQHIRRDKATSNICTAQALLANMAAFYGCYHGPEGLKKIAGRIHHMAVATADALAGAGYPVKNSVGAAGPLSFFDTFVVDVSKAGGSKAVQDAAAANGVNVRVIDDKHVGVSMGEAITKDDIVALLKAFKVPASALSSTPKTVISSELARATPFLTHPNFNSYHSETQMLRYMKSLENKDLSLNFSMISLGSCTMKLNATVEMQPVTWPETCNMHPFAPADQTKGYQEMIESLNKDLAEITGFAAVSAQPNSGAQGEYAGLLCIRAYHKSRGQGHRNVCLIPVSAHGTNPASANMCGMKV